MHYSTLHLRGKGCCTLSAVGADPLLDMLQGVIHSGLKTWLAQFVEAP